MKFLYSFIFLFLILISDLSATKLFTADNRQKYCELDTIIIYNDIPKADSLDYKYSWLRQSNIGEPVTILIDYLEYGENSSIRVYRSGYYWQVYKDKNGKEFYSDTIFIEVVDKPDANILADGKFVDEDKKLYFCNNFELELEAIDAESWIWYRDFQSKITEISTQSKIKVSEEGRYFAVGSIQNLCYDTTFSITVVRSEEGFTLSRDTINFKLNKSSTKVSSKFRITNLNNTELFITKQNAVIIPASVFTISSPLPITIPAKSSQEVEITFVSYNADVFINHRLEITDICVNKHKIILNGEKNFDDDDLFLSDSVLNYDTQLFCANFDDDKEIIISNITSDTLFLQAEMLVLPYTLPLINNSIKQLPTFIEPNKSKTITVRYNPGKLEGNHNTILTIPYFRKQQKSNINIALNALMAKPKMSLSTDTLVFPNVPECMAYSDTFMIVTNTGIFPIFFRDKSPTPELEFLNTGPQTPLELKPGESDTIWLRFKPQKSGLTTFNQQIIAIPCSIFDIITIEGYKTESSLDITFSDNTFPNSILCDENDYAEIPLNIFVDGEVSQNSFISEINLSDGFVSNLTKGTQLKFKENNSFYIRSVNNKEGLKTGTIEFTIEPCGLHKEIDLSILWQKAKYEIESTLDFPNIYQNEKLLNKHFITIKNENTHKIRINDINHNSQVFSLSVVNKKLPLEIDINKTDTIWIDFNGKFPNSYSDIFEIVIDEPCDSIVKVKVSGTVDYLPEKVGNITAKIDGDYSAYQSNKVEYSISLLDGQDFALDSALINSIYFKIKYNGTLLYPESLTIATQINSIAKEVNANESKVGEYDVEIKLVEANKLQEGEIARIEFMALVSQNHKSEILIDSIDINSDTELSYQIENRAKFTLLEDCNTANGANVVFTSAMKMNILYDKSENQIIAQFTPQVDENLSIYLLDYLGAIIEFENLNAKSNQMIQHRFKSKNLPQNPYWIYIQQGKIKDIKKVFIQD